MKKTMVFTLLALSLVACEGKDLDDPRVKDALNQKEIAENIEQENEEDTQVDYENESTNEEDDEINRTYPEEKAKKDIIDVENSTKKADEKDKKDKKDKEEKTSEKDKKDKKDNKEKKEEKNSSKEKEALTEDDYFFSYYDLVTVKDGEVTSALKEVGDYDDDYFVDYVPFSNNLLVVGSNINQDFSLRKINGQELTLIYDFKDNETFYPLGMIGDKIYGNYQYFEYTNTKGDYKFIPEKSGLAVVDLKNNKLDVFKATNTSENEFLAGVGISDKEALFTKMEENSQFNLYKLDLEKGFDQEAELVEENTMANLFLSSKNFKDGKANYEIFRSNENIFEIKGNKYIAEDAKRMSLIGQNIIIQEPTGFSYNPENLFKMDIINYLTGEVVEKDLESYGYRVYKGKFYYIDKDKKVQSLEIGL